MANFNANNWFEAGMFTGLSASGILELLRWIKSVINNFLKEKPTRVMHNPCANVPI